MLIRSRPYPAVMFIKIHLVIIHSGTVARAREALMSGVLSIVISLNWERDERICLCKSLWSDAEAAVDSMLFEMKLIKMEFEMEKLKMRNRGTLEFCATKSVFSQRAVKPL